MVEGFEQRFIIAAYALIGVAHHFCRHKRLTVGYALVVLDDLRLDVVKRKVRFPCLWHGCPLRPKAPLRCYVCS